jgi:hypothetical protein
VGLSRKRIPKSLASCGSLWRPQPEQSVALNLSGVSIARMVTSTTYPDPRLIAYPIAGGNAHLAGAYANHVAIWSSRAVRCYRFTQGIPPKFGSHGLNSVDFSTEIRAGSGGTMPIFRRGAGRNSSRVDSPSENDRIDMNRPCAPKRACGLMERRPRGHHVIDQQ